MQVLIFWLLNVTHKKTVQIWEDLPFRSWFRQSYLMVEGSFRWHDSWQAVVEYLDFGMQRVPFDFGIWEAGKAGCAASWQGGGGGGWCEAALAKSLGSLHPGQCCHAGELITWHPCFYHWWRRRCRFLDHLNIPSVISPKPIHL